MSENVRDFELETLDDIDEEIRLPRRYGIVIHNDDYTTQDFVVHILCEFFHKNLPKAQEIMLKVHIEGKALVGIYSKDVAESKVSIIHTYARKNDMPLYLTVEPV